MENSLKGLMLAAGTIITCLVVTLGFFISREAQDTATNGVSQISGLNSEFAASDKAIYDGALVSGSEVLNVIKKYANDSIGVYVKTGKASIFYNSEFDLSSGDYVADNKNTYTLATDNTKDTYINPYGNFKGRVVTDGNNVITGIEFVQQE